MLLIVAAMTANLNLRFRSVTSMSRDNKNKASSVIRLMKDNVNDLS